MVFRPHLNSLFLSGYSGKKSIGVYRDTLVGGFPGDFHLSEAHSFHRRREVVLSANKLTRIRRPRAILQVQRPCRSAGVFVPDTAFLQEAVQPVLPLTIGVRRFLYGVGDVEFTAVADEVPRALNCLRQDCFPSVPRKSLGT